MNWLWLVLINTVSTSLYNVLQRVLLKEEQSDPAAHAFVFQLLTAGIIFLYIILFSQFTLPDISAVAFNLLLMTCLYVAMNIFLFKAFKTVEASQVGIFFASNSVWVLLWSALFLNESVTPLRIIGTLLVVLGVGVVLWQGKLTIKSSGVLYTLIAALLFGSAFSNDAYLLRHFDTFSYLTLAFFLPSLGVLLVKPSLVRNLSFYKNSKRLLKLVLVSVLYSVSVISIFLAYTSGGDASQINPISQSSIIFTVVLSYLFLNERDSIYSKLLGALIIIGGVILLV